MYRKESEGGRWDDGVRAVKGRRGIGGYTFLQPVSGDAMLQNPSVYVGELFCCTVWKYE